MTLGSLFSGIGGIDLAFERAGFTVAWQVEIDKQARSVLSRHWPDVPRFEDVRDVGKKQLSKVDVIAFGSPCQDLSVAGQRKGMAGERSGLFFEALRIVRELRPAFIVWENVMGAFSSNAGRDFAAVLRGVYECRARDIAWRVLDAQYCGLAQRRERVFLVADFRGERAGEILFESSCMCGHPPTRREAGEGLAATLRGRSSSRGVSAPGRGGKDDQNIIVAPTLPARTKAGGGQGTDFDCDGGLIIANACIAHQAKGGDPTTDNYVVAFAQNQRDEVRDLNGLAGALAGEPGMKQQTYIAHTLRADGFDASEDGTGRGTPIVPFVFQTRIARNGRGQPKETVDSLVGSESGTHGDSKPHVSTTQGVRRLTPLECERLQGLPDDWTRYTADGKEQKDGPRYKQIGNGVAVPCLEWIATRIMETQR